MRGGCTVLSTLQFVSCRLDHLHRDRVSVIERDPIHVGLPTIQSIAK